ncbi:YdeI/OmpD-associated family protein [Pedobacter sp. KR3-3]|uniref:YdeI/OmpD-associated family protein n=1 Tax=Pedobacter albus TaxID=3113905 RepID=A0ABU7I4A3_9SPHI|nr:YdeI/OmpD-associated family protein [Pedobacter sp. KR3-3]MEE1944275.1 YdeI/OmpD-associated family protein [Pedobacter sp. KR3-3]
MEHALFKKLQVKPGFKVNIVNAPANASAIFDPIPTTIDVSFAPQADFDAILIFAQTKTAMMDALKANAISIGAKTICWILYPKAKSGLATDLNLMQSWDDLKVFNLAPCASAAINETWTALRIKPADAQKKSGVGNQEITGNAFGEYIDVANKKVKLPVDLKNALERSTKALAFYEQLSYSNQKEYVLWILTAKQEKTRLDRIEKAIEKLENSLKNPSAKS